MPQLPTMKIVNGEDYTIINTADFDVETMEPYDEESAAAVGMTLGQPPADLSDAALDAMDRDGLKAVAESLLLDVDKRAGADVLREAIVKYRDAAA